MIEILSNISYYLVSAIGSLGYMGIFLLMAIESTIFPLPSELVLIPAGFLAFQGELKVFPIIILSTLGSLFGSLVMYYLSFQVGRKAFLMIVKKYGKLVFLDLRSLIKTENYFRNHGQITVFVGRIIPVVRHLISIPAGFARMPIYSFIVYTSIGSAFWSVILVCFGFYLGIANAKANFNLVIMSLIIFSAVLVAVYVTVRILIRRN